MKNFSISSRSSEWKERDWEKGGKKMWGQVRWNEAIWGKRREEKKQVKATMAENFPKWMKRETPELRKAMYSFCSA